VDLSFDPAPRVGATTCTVALADAAGAPVTGATVEVEGNMNHAGMVPELADAEELGDGRYAADIEFTMGGDWFFVVTVKTQAGERVERVVEVPGVAAP